MTCFCGCETFVKDSNGFKVGCVKCNHGAQNHEESFKLKPLEEGVKSVALYLNYSPITLTRTRFGLLPSNSP